MKNASIRALVMDGKTLYAGTVDGGVFCLKDNGNHDVQWNAKDVSSGIYLYKLTAGEYIGFHKTILPNLMVSEGKYG
jgi:hypothetical protein